MKMLRFGTLIMSVAVLAMLSGCVTPPPKISSTTSGKPEIMIKADVDSIKSAVIGDLVNEGYTFEKDTNYQLELSRPANIHENLIASMTISKGTYSTNARVVSYTFVKTPDGVRVIASMALRAQLPLGQVNSMPWDDNNDYNTFQRDLNDIKERLEKPKT